MSGRSKFLFVLIPLVLSIAGCDLKTIVDYDRDADFSGISTYAWAEKEEREVSDLDHRRILAAVDRQMELKSLKKVDADPDVYVIYYADEDQQVVIDTTHHGYGYGGGMYWDPYWGGGMGMGMGSSTSRVRKYKEGTLLLDMYDASKKELIWRGSITGTLSDNPRENEKKVNKGLAKLFKKFPPKQK